MSYYGMERLKVNCPVCNELVDRDSFFCKRCGTKLAGISNNTQYENPWTLEITSISTDLRDRVSNKSCVYAGENVCYFSCVYGGNAPGETIDVLADYYLNANLVKKAERTGPESNGRGFVQMFKTTEPGSLVARFYYINKYGAEVDLGLKTILVEERKQKPQMNGSQGQMLRDNHATERKLNSNNGNNEKPEQSMSSQESNAQETKQKNSGGIGKAIAILAIIILIIYFASKPSADRLNGSTWRHTYDAGSYVTVSFSQGNCTTNEVNLVTGHTETSSAKYKIRGDKIDFEPGSKNLTWEISGNQLVLRSSMETIIFDRQ